MAKNKRKATFHLYKAAVQERNPEQYYFTLNAGNGAVIAPSQMYDSVQGCEKGTEAMERAFESNGWVRPDGPGIARVYHFEKHNYKKSASVK